MESTQVNKQMSDKYGRNILELLMVDYNGRWTYGKQNNKMVVL